MAPILRRQGFGATVVHGDGLTGRSAAVLADPDLAESFLGPAAAQATTLKAKLLLDRIEDIRQEPQAATRS